MGFETTGKIFAQHRSEILVTVTDKWLEKCIKLNTTSMFFLKHFQGNIRHGKFCFETYKVIYNFILFFFSQPTTSFLIDLHLSKNIIKEYLKSQIFFQRFAVEMQKRVWIIRTLSQKGIEDWKDFEFLVYSRLVQKVYLSKWNEMYLLEKICIGNKIFQMRNLELFQKKYIRFKVKENFSKERINLTKKIIFYWKL